jgi:hypothetical protein
MRNNLIVLMAIIKLLLFIFISSCHRSWESGAISLKEDYGQLCQNDSDCVLVKEGCCGCHEGGKQKALPKVHKKEWITHLDTKCSDIMCIKVISNDPSCKKSAICKNGHCLLK